MWNERNSSLPQENYQIVTAMDVDFTRLDGYAKMCILLAKLKIQENPEMREEIRGMLQWYMAMFTKFCNYPDMVYTKESLVEQEAIGSRDFQAGIIEEVSWEVEISGVALGDRYIFRNPMTQEALPTKAEILERMTKEIVELSCKYLSVSRAGTEKEYEDALKLGLSDIVLTNYGCHKYVCLAFEQLRGLFIWFLT